MSQAYMRLKATALIDGMTDETIEALLALSEKDLSEGTGDVVELFFDDKVMRAGINDASNKLMEYIMRLDLMNTGNVTVVVSYKSARKPKYFKFEKIKRFVYENRTQMFQKMQELNTAENKSSGSVLIGLLLGFVIFLFILFVF